MNRGVRGSETLHSLHILLTSLSPITAMMESEIGKASIPRSRSLVTAEGALFVCREESTRCPVCAAWKAMEAVSLSLISPPNHDYIGILSQDGPQSCCKGDSGLGVDLHLINSIDVVFYGILDGYDIDCWRVESPETSIESGGLSASSRPGD